MWTTIVTGVFVLAGTTLGVLLEPIKGLLSSRTRTRQLRGERCADILRAIATIRLEALELDADFRARVAKKPSMTTEQTNVTIRSLNQAKADLRLAVSLLRLYGPEKLAGTAEQLVSADTALFQLLNERDEDIHNRAVPPSRVREADAYLELMAKKFAQSAHQWTR